MNRQKQELEISVCMRWTALKPIASVSNNEKAVTSSARILSLRKKNVRQDRDSKHILCDISDRYLCEDCSRD